MTITGFKCINEATSVINCDAHGNNAAICCPSCGYPILFVARKNQKGSDRSHATQCAGCGKLFFIEVIESKKVIILHEKTGN